MPKKNLTEDEKKVYVKQHYLKLAKSDEEKSIIENASELSFNDFIKNLTEHQITGCPPETPIRCMDGSCVAIGEPCPME